MTDEMIKSRLAQQKNVACYSKNGLNVFRKIITYAPGVDMHGANLKERR